MDRRHAVAQFAYEVPSLDSYWRAIVLFGQNVAFLQHNFCNL